MISFTLKPEPPDFDSRVRQPGRQWLRNHPHAVGRPRNCWRRVIPELAEAFNDLCAYSAMYLSAPGTVDHFIPVESKKSLAYEWSNFRYAAGWINSSKQLASDAVLDPFEVGDGWFEIILPSCQLVMTSRCPPAYRARASTMLNKLRLGHGEQVVRYRRQWLQAYEDGHLSLELLEERAPLIALAVRKKQRTELRKTRTRTPR